MHACVRNLLVPFHATVQGRGGEHGGAQACWKRAAGSVLRDGGRPGPGARTEPVPLMRRRAARAAARRALKPSTAWDLSRARNVALFCAQALTCVRATVRPNTNCVVAPTSPAVQLSAMPIGSPNSGAPSSATGVAGSKATSRPAYTAVPGMRRRGPMLRFARRWAEDLLPCEHICQSRVQTAVLPEDT